MLGVIAVAKKKNDRVDASKIADCLRCDFLPACYMAPGPVREGRRTLRYRNLLVRQAAAIEEQDGGFADGRRRDLQHTEAAPAGFL